MAGGLVYRELDESKYHQFQKLLLKSKGDRLQREFLESTNDNEDFVSFLIARLESGDEHRLPIFDGPLTESSFKEPTPDQEQRMYELWRDVSPRTACRVSFWASLTLEHISEGKVTHASWLAANGGITETGEERIGRAFSLNGDAGDKAIDDCVRTIFRRLSGLPAARGNRSVFVNPTFGRGWWRERIVSRIFEREDTDQERGPLLEVVRRNQQYWENLVTMIVSRGSVFGSSDVQDALICTLAKHLTDYPDSPLKSATTLNSALRRFSNLAAAQELGVLEFGEICEIVDQLILRIQEVYAP